MKNNDPLHSLQLKLTLLADGQQVTLSPEEAELYGTEQADTVTDQTEEEAEDGQ